ncbi:hypothetical protein DFR48_10748 [Ciceribacter lividus]|uniref:Uncharacterized protein n=1 Tax=Ciceribacter lividus TaxID=1197950 RepID=A0A6I7HLN0_9HYPH|nr:hypothetical protein [Ciceribacter lividus]RCW23179.1 hypothetical protein DFR48_10748 [Ciceribacter lividus]
MKRAVIIAGALAALWATSAAAESVILWRPEHGQFGAQIIPDDAFGSMPGESGGSSGYDFESREFGDFSKYYPIKSYTMRTGEVLTFTTPKSLKVACYLISDLSWTYPTRWLELVQEENQVTVQALSPGRLAAEVRCAETVPVDGQSYLQIEYLDLSII